MTVSGVLIQAPVMQVSLLRRKRKAMAMARGGVGAEEGGEADEDPHREARGDMPRMAVEGQDLLEALFQFFLVEQTPPRPE